MYVLKQDLLNQIEEATLNQLTSGRSAVGQSSAIPGNDKLWEKQESNTVEQVKSYIRHWYDADKEMRYFFEYTDKDSFQLGDRIRSSILVENEYTLYLCIKDTSGEINKPEITNTDFFEVKDDRNEYLLEIVCVLIIYKLHRKKNPREVPVQRMEDYQMNVKNLEKIQRGLITLNIAERENILPDDPGHEVSFFTFDESNDLEDY